MCPMETSVFMFENLQSGGPGTVVSNKPRFGRSDFVARACYQIQGNVCPPPI